MEDTGGPADRKAADLSAQSRRQELERLFEHAWGMAYRAAIDPSGRLERVRSNPMGMVSFSGVPEAFWTMLGTALYKEKRHDEDPVCETVVMHESVLARHKMTGDNVVAQAVRTLLVNGCSIIYAGCVGTHRPAVIKANAPDVTTPFNAFAVACQALLALDCDKEGIVIAQDDGQAFPLQDLVTADGRVRASVDYQWTKINLPAEMALAIYTTIKRAVAAGRICPHTLLLPMQQWNQHGKLVHMPDDDGPLTIGDTPGIGRIRPRLQRILGRIRIGSAPGEKIGAVLHGGPGTGKTMIARALARESGRHFVFGSVGEWQACGHLGDLLAAMRAAFDEARASQPSILFIDEIDSFGTRGEGGQNDSYHRQVINGFLELVQGSRDRGDVVLVAATNDLDTIDPAILRAGRLGEHIRVPDPRRMDTVEVLAWYLAKAALKGPVNPEVTAESLALRCLGAAPARIRALVHEASALSLEAGQALSMCHFLDATRIVANDGVDDSEPSLDVEKRKWRTAVHEAGHAFTMRMLFGDDRCIDLVTVVPSLLGTGAVVSHARDGCAMFDVGSQIRHGTVAMAGRSALMLEGGLGSVTFGAGSDIEMARRIARTLVGHGVGLDSDIRFLDEEIDAKAHSRAINAWLGYFHMRAVEILSLHIGEIRLFARRLVEAGDMETEEVMKHIGHLPCVAEFLDESVCEYATALRNGKTLRLAPGNPGDRLAAPRAAHQTVPRGHGALSDGRRISPGEPVEGREDSRPLL